MQFKDIKGQTVISNRLTEIIDSGRVSHAQMFLGESVSGALALAIAYAQYLNCSNREHYGEGSDNELRADSCGKCPSCKKYQQLSHGDLHFLFPNANTDKIKSDSISSADFQGEFRQFLLEYNQLGTLAEWYDFVGLDNKQAIIRERDADQMVLKIGKTSYEGSWKVFVVWMAELMKIECANTILKSLEEPTKNTLIILVTENPERIISTVRSRTQIVRIPSSGLEIINYNDEFKSMYVSWMRQLFKLNMASLSAWVDAIHAKVRDQQKQFLLFAQEAIRDSFLRNLAGLPQRIDFGDEKFNNSFYAMITERNIERINNAFDEAMMAVSRNGYGKIVFMELSFRISKALKNR